MSAHGACDIAGVEVSGSLVMDQRVIAKWCQSPPKEAIVNRQLLCGRMDQVPRKRSKYSPITVQKRLVGRLCKRWSTEVEFESDDHELC